MLSLKAEIRSRGCEGCGLTGLLLPLDTKDRTDAVHPALSPWGRGWGGQEPGGGVLLQGWWGATGVTASLLVLMLGLLRGFITDDPGKGDKRTVLDHQAF